MTCQQLKISFTKKCKYVVLLTCFILLSCFCLLHNSPVMILVFAALGMGLCVAFIALVRLPSLKVSTLLLVGLLLYDVFWVSVVHYETWNLNQEYCSKFFRKHTAILLNSWAVKLKLISNGFPERFRHWVQSMFLELIPNLCLSVVTSEKCFL